MKEEDLTAAQRKWLEASRKIGRGAMTPSERKTLESLYSEMMPREKQELEAYIRENYQPDVDFAPIEEMEKRAWTEASAGLRAVFSKPRTVKRKLF